MKSGIKKIIAVVITIIIFLIIFSRIDLPIFLGYFRAMDVSYFGLAMLIFIPQFFIVAYRWKLLISGSADIGLYESFRMCLGAGALNSVLPAKLGDVGKAFIVKRQFSVPLKRGINSVILEKLMDFSSLCLLFLIGLLAVDNFDGLRTFLVVFCVLVLLSTLVYVSFNIRRYRFFLRLLRPVLKIRKVKSLLIDANDYVARFRKDKRLFFSVVFLSVVLWVLHIGQIYLFFLALNAIVQPVLVFALVPAAILVGLLPITIGGMGTRDSALILLFAPYAPPEMMAGVGILTHTRYWIPSLIGLLFIKEFVKER